MSQEGSGTGVEERSIAEVDRIRDIIFGSQMRTYEQQFKRVGARLDQIDKQLEALKAALDSQHADHDGQMASLCEETRQRAAEMERAFAGQVGQVQVRLDKQGADLAAQLREQGGELRKQSQDLRAEFTRALDAMDNDKTSRSHLGDLLMEMGTRLKENADITDLLGQLGKATGAQSG
jgi:hypothetical protein